jgi:PAS domain S-box-containing protein
MGKARILIVEDEVIVAEDVRHRLAGLGYEVVGVVRTGDAAIRSAGDLHPDLVLMDIGIDGDIDGIETAERIRRGFDIPVIFATAYSDDPTLERAKSVGPAGYVLKPFEERELRTTIEVALWTSRADRTVRENERRYRSLLEQAADGIVVATRAGAVLDINAAMLRLLGTTREVALRETYPDLLLPAGKEGERMEFVPDIVEAERVISRPDGSSVTVDVRSRRLDDGTVFVLVRDASERVRREKELVHSVEREQALTDAAVGLASLEPQEIPAALPRALATLAGLVQAENGLLLLPRLSVHGRPLRVEWNAQGGARGLDLLGAAPPGLPWLAEKLQHGETVCVLQTSDLPEPASRERAAWSAAGAVSLIAASTLRHGELNGVLGFWTDSRERRWTGEDLRLVRLGAALLVSAAERIPGAEIQPAGKGARPARS